MAEQVEKVNPDLVARDEKGKPYTVRYEAVNAMLLNEFLKAHPLARSWPTAETGSYLRTAAFRRLRSVDNCPRPDRARRSPWDINQNLDGLGLRKDLPKPGLKMNRGRYIIGPHCSKLIQV